MLYSHLTLIRRPRNIIRTPLEQRQIDETVAAIRLRAHYIDPYEEWEKETRKDALVSQFIDVLLQLLNLYTENCTTRVFGPTTRTAASSGAAGKAGGSETRTTLQESQHGL